MDKKHETVQLRFGQRIGSLLLDGILRCQDEERGRQWKNPARHGYAMFLHRFEESALRFGRRAIYFVGQNDVRKDRTLHEDKRAPTGVISFLKNVGASNVRGHEVGRKLNAVELE